MSNLTVFDFKSNSVRVVEKDGEPWFVAKDVLNCMKSSTTVSALKALVVDDLGDEFVRSEHLSDTLGRMQEMMILSKTAA
jgi:prophage antirepressor-like protein